MAYQIVTIGISDEIVGNLVKVWDPLSEDFTPSDPRRISKSFNIDIRIDLGRWKMQHLVKLVLAFHQNE